MQSVLSESNFFCCHGNDNSTIRAATSNGTRCFIAAVRKIQRHRSGHGSGIFEPEPFQPGFSRHLRVLSRTVSFADADPEIFAEKKAITDLDCVGVAAFFAAKRLEFRLPAREVTASIPLLGRWPIVPRLTVSFGIPNAVLLSQGSGKS